MRMERAKMVRWAVTTGTLFGASLLSGCRSGTFNSAAQEEPVTTMMTGAAGTGAVSQLDFFDALERRSSVTWDELLAGVLLAAGKRTDGAYADRLIVAKRAGILGTETPPGADALATPGDMAKLLLRAQGIRLRNTLSDDEALALAARRSLVHQTLGAGDPLTGAVAVRALAAAGQPAGTARSSPHKTVNATTKPPIGGSNP